MRGVRPLLPTEIHARVAAPFRRLVALLRLGPKTLQRRPGLDQGAVHREVVVGGVALHQRQRHHALEKLLHQPVPLEAFPILGEDGGVPHPLVRVQVAEPAVEQVPVQSVHQPPLRGDGVQGLQQHGFQQGLRRNRRATRLTVGRLEVTAHSLQHLVRLSLDRTQGMILGQPFLGVGDEEHRVLQVLGTTHGSYPPRIISEDYIMI